METQLLEAFVAVVNTGSFSAAADHQHLTQPAISKRIAQLEEHLNCRLFDRIGRNVNLTEAGTALLPRAQNLLRELNDTRQHIRDLSGAISGNLRLAISHHIGLHRLPLILKAFTSEHPQVSLELDFMDSELAYEAVRQGRFELAVITLAPQDHPKILATAVWRDPLQLVSAREHPLAILDRLSIDKLCTYPAILPGLNTYTGRMIKQFFDNNGKHLNATMATNYLETIKMMVSVGLGWSMLPATMLDSTLVALECEKLSIERSLGLIHHRDKTLSNAARTFIELLQAEGDRSA
ncbi:MAG: LysR family transcriptional regulator [Gammaproteobacteria bacterium]|nr:MAG: LysR family transcriptional regulator [Gammaproteobacteria bacterium]